MHPCILLFGVHSGVEKSLNKKEAGNVLIVNVILSCHDNAVSVPHLEDISLRHEV